MDRREAILRELNLYPLWVRRDAPVQTGAEDGAQATVDAMDKTAGQLAGETTGQSAKPTENGDKVAGYNPAKDAVQIFAYSHPAGWQIVPVKPAEIMNRCSAIGLN